MEKTIDFNTAQGIKDLSAVYSMVDNSYLFSFVKAESSNPRILDDTPMKLSGMMMILVKEGSLAIDINFEAHTLEANNVVTLMPGNLVRVDTSRHWQCECYVLFFDLKFLKDVNINLAAISIPHVSKKPKTVLPLTPDEAALLLRYFELLQLNTGELSSTQFNKHVARSLIAAMFYQLVTFYHTRLNSMVEAQNTGGRTLSRRHDYVREFIKLVHVYYIRERAVAFYANKLFISPKYLSLLVKEATGRSAARWIDDFVLMEAKNMLRYSGKNIQQVAYALNFSTQSSFGKYFKHLTGQSPTEFQKT